MNPLLLPGLHFFYFYIPAFAVCVGITIACRGCFRPPFGTATQSEQLKPIEVGFLQGGRTVAIGCVVMQLVHDGFLALQGSLLEVLRVDGPIGQPESQLFTAVRDSSKWTKTADGEEVMAISLHSTTYRDIFFTHIDDTKHLDEAKASLVRNGLLMSRGTRFVTHYVPLVIPLTVVALGTVRFRSGIINERPAGYLFFTLVASSAILWWLLCRAPQSRSCRGDRLLDEMFNHDERLTKVPQTTRSVSRESPKSISDTDAAVAVALLEGGMIASCGLIPIAANSSQGWFGVATYGNGYVGSTGCAGGGCGGGGCGGGGCGGCGG